MTGKLGGELPGSSESAPADECMNLLRTLEPSEIIEVLSGGFCSECQSLLKNRIQNIIDRKNAKSFTKEDTSSVEVWSAETSFSPSSGSSAADNQQRSNQSSIAWSRGSPFPIRQKPKAANLSPTSVNNKKGALNILVHETPSPNGNSKVSNEELSEEQKEWIRFTQVVKKKDFVLYELIHGKEINVLKGLELYTGVFNAEEQKKIVEYVYLLQKMGQKGQLRARTYTEPKKWMRGKGRVTIQFGCCYNYALDKDGNPPGIIRDEEVDPLPPVFKQMIKRMVAWHILPPTCVPNSCIVNIYDEGDCIPPHIDHHDFLRPFCTVSFLSECDILFGSNLKSIAPGEFSGPVSIPLPVGSVLILNGNGADVAKHCVPAVPAKRISVTFRKMDDGKLPYKFSTDPELLNMKPLLRSSSTRAPVQRPNLRKANGRGDSAIVSETTGASVAFDNNDFPPLGSLSLVKR
ncbi:RNA demethylase alkbh9b [Ancistrocladus abbreviatus]